MMKSDYIWMNGEFVPYEKATVHILNPTMHYGMGMFEGIRCYNTAKGSAVFRLQDHLERLLDSVQIVGIRDYQYSCEDLRQVIHQTIKINQFKGCYIRPLVYMLGPFSLSIDTWQSATMIAVWEWDNYLGEEALDKGIRMGVSSFTRHHPNVMMTKAKVAGNYVNSTLAITMVARNGFDEAIMLDPQGYVAECTGENIFLVRDGVITTPPRTAVLEGITRDSIITLARDLGYTVKEEMVARDQLYIADEIFICGTAAEVVAVCDVDYRKIGSGHKGPVTDTLQKEFSKTVRGEGARSAEWLDYLDNSPVTIKIAE
jgi:branched-chain amino acid aminotransferase